MAASPTTQDEMERRGRVLPNGRHILPTRRPSAVGTAPAAFGSSNNIQPYTVLSSPSPGPHVFSATQHTNNAQAISHGNPSKALPALQAPAMKRQISTPHINNAAASPYSSQKEAEEDRLQALMYIGQGSLRLYDSRLQEAEESYVPSDRHHFRHKEVHSSQAQEFQPQNSVTQSPGEEAIGSGESTQEELYLTQHKELQQVADQGPGQIIDAEDCVDSSTPSTPASSDNIPRATVAKGKGKGVDKPRPYPDGVKYRCEKCGRQFSRKDNLRQHDRNVHKCSTNRRKPGAGHIKFKSTFELRSVFELSSICELSSFFKHCDWEQVLGC
ncbi:hypothetical protein J7T55_005185 [Diaporthe amygdali]|uniref:uncharacterized protein n=1 Tax=Phomopsis amygdali TaxID=1214568 RepID=UPI0022FE06D3|nr:uncharacterized protein J7T55_005185 [Diaporthe amygdali]KAJ0116239.1 hypothetical protein J7T55_005185 [Diaporthe amygdali]